MISDMPRVTPAMPPFNEINARSPFRLASETTRAACASLGRYNETKGKRFSPGGGKLPHLAANHQGEGTLQDPDLKRDQRGTGSVSIEPNRSAQLAPGPRQDGRTSSLVRVSVDMPDEDVMVGSPLSSWP